METLVVVVHVIVAVAIVGLVLLQMRERRSAAEHRRQFLEVQAQVIF